MTRLSTVTRRYIASNSICFQMKKGLRKDVALFYVPKIIGKISDFDTPSGARLRRPPQPPKVRVDFYDTPILIYIIFRIKKNRTQRECGLIVY